MKDWWKSKTIWIGILEILSAVGLAVADFLQVGDFTAPAIVLFFTGVLMIVLRFLTDTKVVL